jgi:methylated-DNA-[protein]-cysteine S-methyltransferase
LFYSEIDTRFGCVGVIWRETPDVRVNRILLEANKPDKLPETPEKAPNEIKQLLESIKRFLNGEDIKFSLDLLELDQCTGFQRKVLLAEYGIPRGKISTYKRIAKHIGNPKAIRAVGNALGSNPCPLVIPCHRAVRSDGTLGGYLGGIEMKQELLRMEGIHVIDGRVKMLNLEY